MGKRVSCLRDCIYSVPLLGQGRHSSPAAQKPCQTVGLKNTIPAHGGYRVDNNASYSLCCRKGKAQLFLYKCRL